MFHRVISDGGALERPQDPAVRRANLRRIAGLFRAYRLRLSAVLALILFSAALGVVPAFRWERTQIGADRLEHTRRAQQLRVELARPWFQTGEGEQLVLILAPSDTSVAADTHLVVGGPTRITSGAGKDLVFIGQGRVGNEA